MSPFPPQFLLHPPTSSPWLWIVHHWVYFLHLYPKTGCWLNMLLLILCNHTTKLTSTAMACSPGSGVRFTGSSEGGQDASSSYTYMKACPCFIQHTEMATRPLQISKPSKKVIFFFFFFPLHRKLNTKIDSKESKRVVKQRFKKIISTATKKKIQISSYCLFRAD